jgi:hypothetical protein
VVGRQRCDRGADDGAVLRVTDVIARREGDLGRDVRRLPAGGSQAIAAGVDEDPVEPLLEARRVAQRRPLAPGLDERVVRRVLCLGGIAQDRPGQAIRLVEVLVGQRMKAEARAVVMLATADGRSANSMTSDDCLTMT